MKVRQKRFAYIMVGLMVIGIATALILNALNSNVAFYFTPTQVFNKEVPLNKAFRIGGLVEAGSMKREGDGLTVHFVVTDTARSMPVVFKGILPDLFREGKGVVAQGKLEADGVFRAEDVLAKHDENYMPPEAKSAIEQAQKQKGVKP
ncbi:cytochrome c maturation protein CcmE [Sulfurirhabdus autotrophica]|uniref:Cytochrome c-type biogenesis protein CcmE n=1 Tax=Sulfurirhabdus autotrophica TaxID=1706046 RepID=A0A4R3YAR5_9PROT|nr:cytochrome c maturation protein CcmE [Sulfurirhabdus autotrophica]TCV89505.1 cytochrome c-type biogenesis protein CcmE [Sulfurirhabdus autotrophica]